MRAVRHWEDQSLQRRSRHYEKHFSKTTLDRWLYHLNRLGKDKADPKSQKDSGVDCLRSDLLLHWLEQLSHGCFPSERFWSTSSGSALRSDRYPSTFSISSVNIPEFWMMWKAVMMLSLSLILCLCVTGTSKVGRKGFDGGMLYENSETFNSGDAERRMGSGSFFVLETGFGYEFAVAVQCSHCSVK